MRDTTKGRLKLLLHLADRNPDFLSLGDTLIEYLEEIQVALVDTLVNSKEIELYQAQGRYQCLLDLVSELQALREDERKTPVKAQPAPPEY